MDAGRDASMDAAEPPPDAAADASRIDAGPPDSATPGPDANRDADDDAACPGSLALDCTDDCTYDPDYDLSHACNTESSYVLEGTCGDYRYRATGDGYVGSTSYYRIDTGELVAYRGYSDESGCSPILGDIAVVNACEFDLYRPDNLCCFTERGEYIEFCEVIDSGT